jgi:hypothetical protein
VPFKMAQVDEQVVNGVRIQGARVPVWTDQMGRPAGRPTSSTPNRSTKTNSTSSPASAALTLDMYLLRVRRQRRRHQQCRRV